MNRIDDLVAVALAGGPGALGVVAPARSGLTTFLHIAAERTAGRIAVRTAAGDEPAGPFGSRCRCSACRS